MAQHDYNIGDQNGFDFLVDLNNALSAIVTNNAGSFEPNPTFAHMLWFDKNNDLMKVRNETNSAWVIVAKKDGSGWTPYRQGTALGTASVQPDTRYAHRSNNLSDLESAATARGNLGVADDSSDPDFTNNPNAAARRGLVDTKLSALPITKEYQSSAQTIVGSGSLTLAHGLGEDPKILQMWAQCTSPDLGYAIGDKVFLAGTASDQASGRANTVRFDDTNLYVKFAAAAGGGSFLLSNKITGNDGAIDNADWDFYVRAFA